MWHRKQAIGRDARPSRWSSYASSGDSGDNDLDGSSLLVTAGLNRKGRQSKPVARKRDTLDATEIVSGLTIKQVDDLRKILQENLKIEDTIDLRQMVESVGVVISDDAREIQNLSSGRSSDTHRTSTVRFSNLAPSNSISRSEDDDDAP